jgi:hypothetical protein
MKRFWIKFYSFNLKNLECLELSTRNYEKLKINRVNQSDHFNLLINLPQNWKKILIYNCEFKHFTNFIQLIETFAESVEELEISDIEILNYDDFCKPIFFANMKRFMLRNVPSKALELFLKSSKSLKCAAFDIPQEVSDASLSLHDITKEILINSNKLKQLQLGPNYIKALFSEENEELFFNFRLSHFLLKFPIVNDLFPHSCDNIAKFLQQQTNIEWLIAMELRDDKILRAAWNEIPSLKRCSFAGLEDLFDTDMEFNLNVNLHLTQVDLFSRKVLISQLRNVLKAAPLIHTMHVRNLNKHMMCFIAKNHFYIKYLYYEHIEEDVMDEYKQLVSADVNDVNKNIQVQQRSFWFEDNPFSLDPLFWRKE